MKSSTQHIFAQVPHASIPRSSFRRNMTWKTAFDSGYLVPIYVDEALPGDTFNCNLTQFCRLSSPLSLPVMDNIYLDTFFFAVPVRLLWEHFTAMCGERKSPEDSIDYLAPILSPAQNDVKIKLTEQSLSDYLGLPIGEFDPAKFEATSLWHRAYNLVWNEWFRDENLQDPVEVPTGDGPDPVDKFKLLRRGKRHDYFTSSLPFVQKGPASMIGLAGYAPVSGFNGEDYQSLQFTTQGGSIYGGMLATRSSSSSTYFGLHGKSATEGYAEEVPAGSTVPSVAPSSEMWPSGQSVAVERGLFADLSQASAITVNSLREAFAIQRQLERDARAGTRFFEILRANFGVTSPDSRLQRPEYLGGGSTPIMLHTVAQTSATETGSLTPQGNLTAYGVAGGNCGFIKSFVEHSVIIGLACVRCDLTYQQGLHRMFSRRSRFDWYWPALHNLGEQAVLNKEIYCDGSDADNKPFGYQERWAEYRYGQSRITGKLRSQSQLSLDAWHLAQYFSNRPALNAEFIEEHPPLNRILAVQDEPQLIYDSLISLNCVRPMGCYSVPGLIDHL